MKSRSVPTLLVLLWHHFCFYKRHWITLIATICLPFLLIGFLVLIFSTISSRGGETVKPSQPNISALLSTGAMDATLGHVPETNCLLGRHRRTNLDYVLRNNITCNGTDIKWDSYDPYSCKSDGSYKDVVIDKLLRGYIFYYPNNSKLVEQVVDGIADDVSDFIKFLLAKVDSSKISSLPPPVSMAIKMSRAKIGCIKDIKKRIIGFKDLNDVKGFINDYKDYFAPSGYTWDHDTLKGVWGIIDFKRLDRTAKIAEYALVFESRTKEDVWEPAQINLQSLVESSIVSVFARRNVSQQWSVFLRHLPSKCWNVPSAAGSNIVIYVLAIALIISFMLCPMNALNQMVTEKTLRLREYLAIMGVSSFSLKFSWWLFYMLLLLPLSLFISLFVFACPPGFFQHTSFFLIFITILLFNMAQLSFCFLMSSFLTTTRRTGMLLAFLHVSFWIITLAVFHDLNTINGAQYYWAHCLCLYCAVPLTLAMMYLGNWEQWWIGTHSYNVFTSPYPRDEFEGIGACIIWLAVDTVLYMVIAWYIDKVLPGDYGPKHPPYFLFLPSYWFPCRLHKEPNTSKTGNAGGDIEEVDENAEIGIQIHNLTKIYGKGQTAVNNLSIDFYKKEVTAFLGQNGAGKSTTFNSLVGVINPTSGTLEIDGLSVVGGIPAKLLTVGFVPQHDILYPSLTLDEHLLFYGMLKGLSPSYIRESTQGHLDGLDLARVRQTCATKLSGGQKRKLSILTAYLGDPSAVILDEPTSGVDPFSRRSIWDLVQQHRLHATTIISTHQMQEADLLGDRIAIISNGELVCYGSPSYLKQRYGSGIRLTVAMADDNEQTKKAVTDFVLNNVRNAKLDSEIGADIAYLIPQEETKHIGFADFLSQLSDSRKSLHYRAYGISEASMEQVFFKAIGFSTQTGEKLEDDAKEDHDHADNSHDAVEDGVGHFSSDVTYEPTSGITSAVDQLRGLLLKRLLFGIRSIRSMIYQFMLPLTFIVILLVISTQVGKDDISDEIVPVHLWAEYRTNLLFSQGLDTSPDMKGVIRMLKEVGPGTRCIGALGIPGFHCERPDSLNLPQGSAGQSCSSCDDHCTDSTARSLPHQILPTSDILFSVPSSANLTEWLIRVNSSQFISLGGYEFTTLDPDKLESRIYKPLEKAGGTASELARLIKNSLSKKRLIMWTRRELQMAMLNGINNVLLRSLLNSSTAGIKLDLHKSKLNHEYTEMKGLWLTMLMNLLSAVVLTLAFSFAAMPIITFAAYEKTVGLKRLQRINGVSPALYWISNFLYDFLIYSITLGIIVLILGLAPGVYHHNVLPLVTVMWPFGLMITPFMYLITFFFPTQAGATTFLTIMNFVFIFIGSVLGILSFWMTTLCGLKSTGDNPLCGLFDWLPPLCDGLRIIPSFYLSESLQYATLVVSFQKTAIGLIVEKFRHIYKLNMLGKYPLTAAAVGVVLMVLVILLEYLNFNVASSCSCSSRCCCRASDDTNVGSYNIGAAETDVRDEENRVLQQSAGVDALEAKQLRKVYPGAQAAAVSSVTFSVLRKECFGLLGVNGAGKTTLFKMLTGFLKPTSGTAAIEGISVSSRKGLRSKQFSYCPQDNILIEHCTVLEHLRIFTLFRGIPNRVRSQLIELLLQELDLFKYKNIKSSDLSGGNQRKLQFALALFSYPPLIFLDEPTTGMDPGARRKCWAAINRAIERGSGVVLTSHTMEECEALCHRLVIMVCGQFYCIGSVQYLKDKFGDRYVFKIKLKLQDHQGIDIQQTDISALKAAINGKLSSAHLVEDLPALLHYDVPANDVQLHDLFRSLIHWQATFPVIEDFSVSQLTLEQVFINMAQKQEVLQTPAAAADGATSVVAEVTDSANPATHDAGQGEPAAPSKDSDAA